MKEEYSEKEYELTFTIRGKTESGIQVTQTDTYILDENLYSTINFSLLHSMKEIPDSIQKAINECATIEALNVKAKEILLSEKGTGESKLKYKEGHFNQKFPPEFDFEGSFNDMMNSFRELKEELKQIKNLLFSQDLPGSPGRKEINQEGK